MGLALSLSGETTNRGEDYEKVIQLPNRNLLYPILQYSFAFDPLLSILPSPIPFQLLTVSTSTSSDHGRDCLDYE
jgi:hypothetical protein